MKKILVVDDEDAFRQGVATHLKLEGFDVIEARDGLEGIEKATTQLPDVILTDVQMDNMNGFVMVEELRQIEATSLIPVIVMTGAAAAAGAWDADIAVEYLEKPFDLDDLTEAIKRVLPS
ncbi:MAG TPA: two-component system response regulator [Bacteroidetes bacterium]|nr:two-component system response regulator [Bacteroidota bacterium]